jgi:TRAP-type C4-dicarboxylate transport system substrate-binding protein
MIRPGWYRLSLLILTLLSCRAGAATPEHIIKFATLAPVGSTWMNLLQDWDTELRTRSGDRIGFKFYPGGVQGDEPQVLQKMRFDQLQGGAFTGYGIGRMYSPARVLELPFLFRTTAEIDYVRERLTQQFSQGFEDHGYVLLGWMEVGFVHIFSRQPVSSLSGCGKATPWARRFSPPAAFPPSPCPSWTSTPACPPGLSTPCMPRRSAPSPCSGLPARRI